MMEEEQLGAGAVGQGTNGQKMDEYQPHRRLDYSGLYEHSQKHMLDFEDLDFSQKSLEFQNCSQKNGRLLGEDEDNSQRRRFEEGDASAVDADLPSSQILTVDEYQLLSLSGTGGYVQGLCENSPRLLPITSNSEDDPLQFVGAAELNGTDNRLNGLSDTINSEQENALLQFLNVDGPAGGLGSELQLSQGSLLGLGSINFNQEEQPESNDNDNYDADEGGLGSETVSFEDFKGIYGFEVKPIDKGKCCFSETHNKFYCDCGTYGFNIKLKFEDILNPEKFVIRTALVFTDPQYQNTPVVKCLNCAETQKKFLNDKEKAMVSQHIVRGHQEDSQVTYVTSASTNFCYALIGVRHPEPGCTTLVQKLAFTCRSSCKTTEERGISRRPTALVFTLLNNRKAVCGRCVINLRICSAPYRDFKAEFKEDAIAYQARNGKKRKSAVSPQTKVPAPAPDPQQDAEDDEEEDVVEPVQMRATAQKDDRHKKAVEPVTLRGKHKYRKDEEDNESGPSAKVAKVKVESIPQKEKKNDDPEEPVPSTSTKSNSDSNEFDMEKAVDMLYNSSQESSSQESVIEYEDEDKGCKQAVKLRAISRECRKVLCWIKSKDRVQKAAAVQVFESLKFTEQICSKSKKMIKDLHTRSEEKK